MGVLAGGSFVSMASEQQSTFQSLGGSLWVLRKLSEATNWDPS